MVQSASIGMATKHEPSRDASESLTSPPTRLGCFPWFGLMVGGCILTGIPSCSSESVSDCPGLSKIVAASFSRVDDRLRWTLEVESMPDEFVIDRESNPDRMVEYSWQVNVDTDGDGLLDYTVSVNHFKEPDATERVSTDIMGETHHNIYESRTDSLTSIGTFDASLTGTTFTFEVDTSAFPQLAMVSSSSSSSWVTAYRNFDAGRQTCSDRWP